MRKYRNTTPERYPVLVAELKERTGLDIPPCRNAIAGTILLDDTAKLKIHYAPPKLELP